MHSVQSIGNFDLCVILDTYSTYLVRVKEVRRMICGIKTNKLFGLDLFKNELENTYLDFVIVNV